MSAERAPSLRFDGPPVLVERAGAGTATAPAGTFGRIGAVLDTRWHWVAIAQILQAAGMFALFKLTAHLLSVSSFGRFALALAVAGGVNVVLAGPLAGWASRHYQEAAESSSVRSYRWALISASVVGSALLAVTVATVTLAAPGAVRDISLSPQLFALGVTVGLAGGLVDVAIASFNVAFRRRTAATILLLSAWVRVAAVIGAYSAGFDTEQSFLLAMVGALAILGIVSCVLLFRFLDDGPRVAVATDSLLPGLVRYASPFLVWGIPGYLIVFGDKLVLARYEDAGTVGVYAAMIAATVSIGAFAIAVVVRVVEPAVWRTAGSGDDPDRLARAHALIHRVVIILAVSTVPAILAYAAFPQTIITLFSSSAYTGSADKLWLLAVATAFFVVGQQLTFHGLVEKRPAIYIPAKFLHATLLVVLLFVLIEGYGLDGAIYALIVANAVQLGAVALTNRIAGVS